jgi:hypothetical protein
MSDCPQITLSLPVAPAVTIVNPDVLGLSFTLLPVVNGGGSSSGSYDPLGTAAATGQILYGDLTGLSGTVNTSLGLTGQGLYADVVGLSGQAAGTYATITNLTLSGQTLYVGMTGLSGAHNVAIALTGQSLYNLITALSGQANVNYATSVNLTTTGQTFYNDIAGLSGAHNLALTLTGQQALTFATSIGAITSGNAAASGAAILATAASTYATLPNLTLTGVTIEAQLSSLSGWAASSLNLINTGAALYADMTGLSGLVAFLGALQTFTGVNIFLNSGLGNNLTAPGIVLYNPTTASTTNQQYSPAIVWSGQGWKTSAGGASRAVAFRAYAVPIQGGSVPTASWNLDYQVTGGTGWFNVFSINSIGSFTSAGSITANGGFVSASPTLGFYATSALSQVLGATVDASDGFGFYLAFPNQNGQYTQTNTLTLSNNNQNNTLQINGTTVLNQDVSSTGSPAFNGVVLSGNQIGANSSGIVFNGVAMPTGVALAKPIGFSTDGAGNVVVSGIKGYITSPYAGTFTSWSIAAMQAGNITIDIWKTGAGLNAPTASIIGAGGTFPSLSNAQFAYSPASLNWTTRTVAIGDIIAWVVSGAPTSITRFTFQLTIT